MPRATEEGRLEWYRALQAEAVFRVSWIEYAINGKSGLPPDLNREFCYLQLRMICELVALGCLLAHGDIEATQAAKFQSTGYANDILNGLERLTADFYPAPLVETTRGASGERRFMPRPGDDHMTKAELLDLYSRQCGSILHAGSLKNLPKRKPNLNPQYTDIHAITQRLCNLLAFHRMGLVDNRVQLVCIWTTDHDVQVTVAPSSGPPHAA